MLADIKVFEM